MFKRIWVPVAVLIVCAIARDTIAQSPEADNETERQKIQQVAARIDDVLRKRWEEYGITPAERVDDATFLRRVSLDLAGRIPTAAEVRDFHDNDSPTKRFDKVRQLVDGPGYVAHQARLIRQYLVPESTDDFNGRFFAQQFEAWMQQQLMARTSYVEIARALIEGPSDVSALPGFGFGDQTRITPNMYVYYATKQYDPAKLTANLSRSFMGIRLECAQCHDHPFEDRPQKDFWELAAFFGDVSAPQPILGLPPAETEESMGPGRIKIPGTESVIQASLPLAEQPVEGSGQALRSELANWIAAEENPYFAKATVNRLWGQMFGRGIVNPVDDFSDSNPASHPEILELLANAFIESDYDLTYVLRIIATTKAYQLSSRGSVDSSEEDAYPELFARKLVRPMSAEQLWASIGRSVGYTRPASTTRQEFLGADDPQIKFLQSFNTQGADEADAESTILQALTLMNGDMVYAAAYLKDVRDMNNGQMGNPQSAFRTQALPALVEFPLMSDRDRIEALYLSTYSRFPTEDELTRCEDYVSANDNKAVALGDLFWVLLNSDEYRFNH